LRKKRNTFHFLPHSVESLDGYTEVPSRILYNSPISDKGEYWLYPKYLHCEWQNCLSGMVTIDSL